MARLPDELGGREKAFWFARMTPNPDKAEYDAFVNGRPAGARDRNRSWRTRST
ncbi:MAG: hypothetical protein OXL68_01115 [Paracoccaceae bacterium]|nr:hypothetical protein [Paracoccaceae bacterium]